jgi:hypothetical protein
LVRGGEVEVGRADLDAELGEGLLGLLDRECGLHPGLGRDAADAEARASQLRLLLDAGGLGAELRGADRGGVAARTAPQDGNVTFHRSLAPSVAFGSILLARPQAMSAADTTSV